MWMLLDLKLRITLLVVVIFFLAAIYAAISLHSGIPHTYLGWGYRLVSAVSSAIGAVAVLIGLLGPWSKIWQLSLKLPFANRLIKFPDVNGVWVGVRTSSYLNNEAQLAGRDLPPADPMLMRIRQSWLSVRVETQSANKKTDSLSVFAFPQLLEHCPRIWSTYTSKVRGPAATEAENHKGAATIDIYESGHRVQGAYFSDRGIANYLPSSGRFDLRRISPDPENQPSASEIDRFIDRYSWNP